MSTHDNMSVSVAKNTPAIKVMTLVRAARERSSQPLRGTPTSLKMPIHDDVYLSVVVDKRSIETVLVRMGPADVYVPINEHGYDEPGYACQFTNTADAIREYDRLRRLYGAVRTC